MAYSFDLSTGELAPVGEPQMTVEQSWLDSNPPRPYQFFAQPNYNGTFILSPDGRHLYATTRGADTIAGFEVGPDGALSPAKFVSVPSNGRVPWSLSFASDTLLLVANQHLDDPSCREGGGPDADPDRLAPAPMEPGNITVFCRDPTDGTLAMTGAVHEVPHAMGVCVAK
mmetsp:Transcript_10773/g.28771  ORF Transcript_10773/g.28771 Transcript_10773/m.28771 type:complete len:170 (-) Transcript_10773:245-754(-)